MMKGGIYHNSSSIGTSYGLTLEYVLLYQREEEKTIFNEYL